MRAFGKGKPSKAVSGPGPPSMVDPVRAGTLGRGSHAEEVEGSWEVCVVLADRAWTAAWVSDSCPRARRAQTRTEGDPRTV